jgi:hypothetical protein
MASSPAPGADIETDTPDFSTWPLPTHPKQLLNFPLQYPTLESATEALQAAAEAAGFGCVRRRVNYYDEEEVEGNLPRRADFRCHCNGTISPYICLVQLRW